MKKKYIIITLFTVVILGAVSCNSGSTNTNNNSEIQNLTTELYYTCTMHPEVHSDKPGNCPKCGMKLVKKEAAKSESSHMHHVPDSIKQ